MRFGGWMGGAMADKSNTTRVGECAFVCMCVCVLVFSALAAALLALENVKGVQACAEERGRCEALVPSKSRA